MPVQLKTLLPLFAVFIVAFLIARHFLIPESFGEIGHYRDMGEKLSSDKHESLSCEICHGPNSIHAVDPDKKEMLVKDGSRSVCGRCHGLIPARNIEIIKQVDIALHHPEKEKCTDCHNPHAVWELKE
jgi:hypothetical protein